MLITRTRMPQLQQLHQSQQLQQPEGWLMCTLSKKIKMITRKSEIKKQGKGEDADFEKIGE